MIKEHEKKNLIAIEEKVLITVNRYANINGD